MTVHQHHTSAGHAVTIRLRIDHRPGRLAGITAAIADAGGNIGAIDIIHVEERTLVRDITVDTSGAEHVDAIVDRLRRLDGSEFIAVFDRTLRLHEGGKLEVRSKVPIQTRAQLSMAYTPGVARVCRVIAEDPRRVYDLTIKSSTVAVVTDGTAVLGLGNIGPEAALPVMEGKAQLFKEFAGLNAFPICLATTDSEEIIATVKRLAPVFGGINLEDIAAPQCFEIERRLKSELDIPVFHDDQHGTAVVTTAALINALKIVGKDVGSLKVVVMGVGAAGTACARMMLDLGVTNVIGCDSKGAINSQRGDLNDEKKAFREMTNPADEGGSLSDVIRGADVFVGVSVKDVLSVDDLKAMASDPIVFAMANPDPEIRPELAYSHVAVMATGRSDYPNQINNVLCFPGIFKGAMACMATDINEDMKMAAARAIAESVDEAVLSADYIIPSVFDTMVVDRVATAVRDAAISSGVAREANR
jgi:malate dehydrogenase (oxaloacetate-decarboxylating)